METVINQNMTQNQEKENTNSNIIYQPEVFRFYHSQEIDKTYEAELHTSANSISKHLMLD